MNKFSPNDIPDMSSKTVLITGGNSGIGFQTALELVKKNAFVYIACRNGANAKAAESEIKRRVPTAKLSWAELDLADRASIQSVTSSFEPDSLDILINNAGVMSIPKRTFTKDGFETHMGTNHLGHFALTLGLLDRLKKVPEPRVVCMSALVAYNGIFDMENLQSEKNYKPMAAYSQSKLANVLFANELGRREPWLISVAVQPGSAMTNLQRYTPSSMKGVASFLLKFAGQPVENCALPSLYAATQPGVKSGMFFGPTGMFNKGFAGVRSMPKLASDEALAKALWEKSEMLTVSRFRI
jgi:NAD(P)-dependent dehydrogenase (short-subunit alcohol dehydrogenase family)